MPESFYFAYIMASKSRTLYVGVTNDIVRRSFQHKQKAHDGFSARYNCSRLVWFQRFTDVGEAIQREKELKGWTRDKKIALIQARNPTWEDLSESWHSHGSPTPLTYPCDARRAAPALLRHVILREPRHPLWSSQSEAPHPPHSLVILSEARWSKRREGSAFTRPTRLIPESCQAPACPRARPSRTPASSPPFL